MTQPPAPGGGVRRTGRLRGSVDAMASRAAEAPGADPASPGPAASAPGATTNTAAGTSSRRTRFAPAVPGERRARPKPAEEAAAEPQLPQSLRTLVRQAHTEAKATRGTREPVRGLESTASRGTGRARNDARTLAGDQPAAAADVFSERKSSRSNPEPEPAAEAEDRAGRGTRDPADADADAAASRRTPATVRAKREPRPELKREPVASAPGEGPPPAAAPDAFAPASASASAPSSSLLHAAVGASPRASAFEDWIDDAQYYPTALRDDREEARFVAAAESASVADRLDATADPGTFLVVQLPAVLALGAAAGPGPGSGTATEGTATDPRGRVGGDESDAPAAAADAPVDGDRAAATPSALSDLREGYLGELVVRADGSAALEIGETVLDVLPGTTFAHDEQLAAIRVDPNRKKEKGTQSRDADGAERAEGECAFLGRVPGRLVCVPNVDSLLRASGEST